MLRLGQIFKAAKPEELQETFRSIVKVRSAELFASSTDSYQVATEKLVEDFATTDSSDRFDIGSQHRLTIRDNGQSFQSGRRQTFFMGNVVEPPQPLGKLTTGNQLEAAREFVNSERPTLLIQSLI